MTFVPPRFQNRFAKQESRSSCESEALLHCQRAMEVEKLFLSGFANNPVAGWNSAADAGLDHTSFSDPRNSKMFDVLCHCALESITPTPWLIATVLADLGFPFLYARTPNCELTRLWHLEAIPTGLAVWARQVRFYADRRRQARSLFDELRSVLTDPAPDARDLPDSAIRLAPDRLEAAA